MKLIVCLDLKNGLRFNKRRQSRDVAVINRICALTNNSKLYINTYSKKLFALPCTNLVVCSDIFESCEYAFIEKVEDMPDIKFIDDIFVYRWNKVYPQDEVFPINLAEWRLISKENFKGNSHDKITEEIYTK